MHAINRDLEIKLATETLGKARELVMVFAKLKGEDVEFRSVENMELTEVLAETNAIVRTAGELIGGALEHPMLKPVLRMVGRN